MNAQIKYTRYTLETLRTSKGPGNKIHLRRSGSKSRKICFGNLIFLISPTYCHTPSDTNWKWTRLNATPLGRLLIMKLDSQESILKDIQNYPTIYRSKATWFQNTNKNWRGSQPSQLTSTSLLRWKIFTKVCDALMIRRITIGI